jgi:hypothetical protein
MGSLYSIKLEYDDDELSRNLSNFDDRFNDLVSTVFEYNASYATAWMKANAPWHDNTGAARASLVAIANNRGKTHELLLAHGVHYGIWLEVAHNRRWQILASTQRHMGQKIMEDLRTAFRSA